MTKKVFGRFVMLLVALVATMGAHAAATITKQTGWLESAAVEWSPVIGATGYNVYIKEGTAGAYQQLDKELVRQYPGVYRADALGLKAGTYYMKVVPVYANGEMADEAVESGAISVTAHNRTGFAHYARKQAGKDNLGAYNNDGTLMSNAKVIYVWADNAKTVSMDIKSSSNKTTTYTGLQQIVYGYQKGFEATPLDIRIIGTVKAENMDTLLSSEEGLQIKGSSGYQDMHMTIEGVGEDATVSGFGFLIRNSSNVEMRNFAIMLCMDDAISFDTQNSECWVHNMDLYYGKTGGDADQAKGDGTVDIKGKSKNITVSFNHFWDNGKCSLGGMKSESTDCWMSYHHNWFDHSDSRHPRIRTAFYHVYNNYFDGNAKYGVGMTMGGSSFVEYNVFRNCKYPMLISKQGTDAEGSGTFSGENGGVIKAYGNTVTGASKLQYYAAGQTDGKWDAVLATSRSEDVDATAYAGGTSYNNEADAAARLAVTDADLESVETVKATVKQYAGRMNGGDFVWKFNNSVQDANYGVITDLKTAMQNYSSTLVGFADGTAISNGGSTATSAIKGGDGEGISDEVNEAYVPSWGSSSGSSTTIVTGEYVLGTSSDYYWFNADNDATTQVLMTADGKDGISIALSDLCEYKNTREVKGSDGTSYSDYIGAMRIAAKGSMTIHYTEGILAVAFYLSATGSQSWTLEASVDGTDWTAVSAVKATGKKGEHPSAVIYGKSDKSVKYVRITNNATSLRDVQGVKISTPTTTGIGSLSADKQPTGAVVKYVKNGKIYIYANGHTFAAGGVQMM